MSEYARELIFYRRPLAQNMTIQTQILSFFTLLECLIAKKNQNYSQNEGIAGYIILIFVQCRDFILVNRIHFHQISEIYLPQSFRSLRDFLRLYWEALKFSQLCDKTAVCSPSQNGNTGQNNVEMYTRQRLFCVVFPENIRNFDLLIQIYIYCAYRYEQKYMNKINRYPRITEKLYINSQCINHFSGIRGKRTLPFLYHCYSGKPNFWRGFCHRHSSGLQSMQF